MKRVLIRVVVGLMIPIVGASAQSVGTRFGLDAAPFYVTIDGENFSGIDSGFGFEVQGRLMGPAWSVGLGWHRSSHAFDGITDDLILSGVFVEPRYQFPGQGFSRLYFVARGGWALHRLNTDAPAGGTVQAKASGLIVGAGVGMAFALAPAVDFNASAMWGPPVVSRRGGERPNRCRFRSEGDERVFARRCVVHVRRSLALATTRPVSAVTSTPALSPDRHG